MKKRIRLTENDLNQLITERVTKAINKRLIKESMSNVERQYYDFLIDSGIVSEDALDLVIKINGNTMETLDEVLYAKTGYYSVSQLTDEFDDLEEYFDDDALEYFGLLDDEEDFFSSI
jgi:site-specific recombinase XerD